MKLNEILSERRKSLGLTQKEVAEQIGVRNATISDFEKGKRNLGSDKLEQLLPILQLTISELPYPANAGGAI
ncbi:MAG: helix-turn-helix domain-containing protein [Candidatus Thorarchaeota archaeon]